MGHAESPSLISLGLTADVSQEGSSFRWGLATSGLLHVLAIFIAVFLRFHSTIEEPLRAMDVTLISLPEAQTPAPSKVKASPPTPSQPKAQPAPPKTQPRQDPLPPLPTQTASERLSEFLGGAIGSIIVPNKQEISSPDTAPQIPDQPSPKDQTPLIEKFRFPSIAPQLSRPERLHPTEPLKIPKSVPTHPRQTTQSPMAPPEPAEPVSSPLPAQAESAVKPAPALPELSPVTPFTRTQKDMRPNELSNSSNLEDSLRRTLPDIQTPSSIPKFQRKPKPNRPQPEKSFVPEMSAPQLARVQPSPSQKKIPPPQEKAPPRAKMSEMMEQLLGEVKVPTLKSSPAVPPSQDGSPPFSSTKSVPSEIDQQIAKLSIPTITPVESIKDRLQLLEVQSASTPGNPVSQPSPGKNRYLAMVEDKIDHQWVAPPLVASAPVVVLKFRISRSGEISRISIDESSGNGHYDSAAQRAVYAVNPLPPFPSDISDSFFEVRFRFIKKD